MDSQEPDQTPFAAVSAQTSRFTRVCFAVQTSRIQVSHAESIGIVIPILPRQVHSLHRLPLVSHWRLPHHLFPPHSHSPGLVHRYVLPSLVPLIFPTKSPSTEFFDQSLLYPRHLPPQPIPRLPATKIRPLPLTGRRHRGRRERPAYETGRGVPTLHTPAARVQILA